MKIKEISALLVLYSIVYFCYTYPTIIEISTKIIGKNDAFGILWNTYIFDTGIHSGKIWTTQQSFYPWGTSLIYHASTPLIGLLTLPFTNKILCLNILIYVMFVISAIGGYFLSKKFINNNYYALICGFIFAFSPYKMARIEEHYTLILTAIIPFFFMAFLEAFSFDFSSIFPKIKSTSNFIVFLFLGFLGFVSDYIITFQMLYLIILYSMFCCILKLYRYSPKWLFWIFILSIIVLMHFIILYLVQHRIDDNGAFWWGGKWTDFIVPYNARIYPHLGSKLNSIFSLQSQIESDMFLGYSLIVASIISIGFYIKSKKIDDNIKALLFVLFLFVLIVMPAIRLPFSIVYYPPTAILHFLPVIKNLRCPTRFINDIMLVLPIIIFYALERISLKKQVKIIVATILFIAVFIEYFPARYSYIDYKNIPKVYYNLSKKPGESVLVYPLGLRDGMKLEGRFDIETMQYQTVYKKKTMGGYISRMADWMCYVHYQNAFTNSLLHLEKDSLFPIPHADYNRALKDLKLDYIVIPQRYRKERAAVFLQSIVRPQMIKSEDINGDLLLSLSR